MRIAVTREVSPAIGRCELEHVSRQPIDVVVARAQHRAYEACLEELGCSIERLPADLVLADSVFVEDVAVVLPEIAIVTRPGAPSRRPECHAIAAALARHRPLVHLQAPATLDGGDVLVAGKTLYVGRSSRTNPEGVSQLEAAMAPLGYRVVPVTVEGCLHLKSAATLAADDLVLVQPRWVSLDAFDAVLARLEVDPNEDGAANVLRVGDTVVCAAAFPRTRRRLEQRGLDVAVVDVSEIAKAEGALTCCSLIFNDGSPRLVAGA